MRVGAVLSQVGETVFFLGYGEYKGEETPPATAVMGKDCPADIVAEYEKLAKESNFKNPKVLLDNGATVWGCQCWWGPEDQIRNMLEGKTVVLVDVEGNKLENKGKVA